MLENHLPFHYWIWLDYWNLFICIYEKQVFEVSICIQIANENQQNAQMIYIFSICSTYMSLLDHHTVHTLVHRTFSVSRHSFLTLILIINITRWLDCGEYIYKQLRCGWMHTSLYYLLLNSTPWRCSSMTETCRCYKLIKYIICAFCWFSLAIILKCTV